MPTSAKPRLLKLLASLLECDQATIAFMDILSVKQLEVICGLIQRKKGR